MKRVGAILPALVLLLVGCLDRSGPTEPQPNQISLGTPFLLAPGETAVIRGEPVQIRFETVTADSRCPPDVACAWAGEARASLVFRLVSESPASFELSTHSPRQADHAGYRTTLLRVLPGAPRAGERIPASNYLVQLQVDR